MSDSIHLLTLPLEIRWHIYSFLYLEHRIVNFLLPKLCYTKTALYLSCQQLYQETLEYYYGRNTFSLHLRHPFVASDCRQLYQETLENYYGKDTYPLHLHHQLVASDCRYLPRHFDLVKVLRIESFTFFWRLSHDVMSYLYTKKCQQRLEKCLEAILGANKGTCAPNLKTVILADYVPP